MIVYVVNLTAPYRPVKMVDADVKLCAKSAWAMLPNGRRCAMGKSAFQTFEAAESKRIENLREMVRNYGLKGKRRLIWDLANRAWIELQSSK